MPTANHVPFADLSEVTVAPSTHTRRAGVTNTAATVLHEAAQTCHTEANKYLQAGNLEETLAQYLRLAKLHEHRLEFCTTAQHKKMVTSELRRVYGMLEQLHTKFQAKKDFFHGCLDDNDDETAVNEDEAADNGNSSKRLSNVTKMDCTDIQPLDASRWLKKK